VALRPGHAAITALFLRRLEFVLVAFNQQAEELAAGMRSGVPLPYVVDEGSSRRRPTYRFRFVRFGLVVVVPNRPDRKVREG
ncbi:hypothetical protein IYQ_24027, partial [Aeromonas salmonicida subsp. salmonicida 01-B526]